MDATSLRTVEEKIREHFIRTLSQGILISRKGEYSVYVYQACGHYSVCLIGAVRVSLGLGGTPDSKGPYLDTMDMLRLVREDLGITDQELSSLEHGFCNFGWCKDYPPDKTLLQLGKRLAEEFSDETLL